MLLAEVAEQAKVELSAILTKRTVKISAWTPASESFPWGACHVYP
jgi:hypothetical protein